MLNVNKGTYGWDIDVGDWVRFYQNNRMVIGEVQYVLTSYGSFSPDIQTDIGAVCREGILEVRKGNRNAS